MIILTQFFQSENFKKRIKKREELKNFQKKIIQTGYFYFDTLKNSLNTKNYSDEILVAPSWNYNEKYFINEDFYIIIDNLIKIILMLYLDLIQNISKGQKILLIKLEKILLVKIHFFDKESENIKSMEKAKLLITDNSGIAIEYCLILKKPVYYYSSTKNT